MTTSTGTKRPPHYKRKSLAIAAGLFVVLVLIALFLNDAIIRPYGGDFIVVMFLYALVRGLTPHRPEVVGLEVFVFACLVEAFQAFGGARLLGLGENDLAVTVIGHVFDWGDIAMYLFGSGTSVILDRSVGK